MEGAPKLPENQEKIQYPEIASEILEMAEEDQRMRVIVQKGGEWDLNIDMRNTERMKKIIENVGWPTKSKVGEWPSYRAWLIVQHSTHEPQFMQACLELMEKESTSEVDPQNIAYLSDRLKTIAGLPQTYGTQYKVVDDKSVHCEIEDIEHVDERRVALGLMPIQEELEMMNKPHSIEDDKK